MQQITPLLSIIIPTKNRIPYCISVIESILNIPDTRLELVIQDNSDTPEIKQYVKNNISDNRLIYNYTNEAFSTIDNFNAAMEASNGDYVCFIGDDDGVNPLIVQAASWAKKKQLDALTSKIKAIYYWPGSNIESSFLSKKVDETLTIYNYKGTEVESNSYKELTRFLFGGGVYYLNFNLPKVYHGIVKRECLELVKVKTGNYFGGLSPDIFSSLAISSIAKRTIAIDYPLTIGGRCPAAEATHSDDSLGKKIKDAPHFKNRNTYVWNNQIPNFYSGKTIWLESGISALLAMGQNNLVSKLNLSKFAADCIIAYPKLSRQIFSFMINNFKTQGKSIVIGIAIIIIDMLLNQFNHLFNRSYNRLLLLLGIRKTYTINNLKNMQECTLALEAQLKKNTKDTPAFTSI